MRKVRRHWALIAVLAIALALRLWNLFPTFFYGDEAEYATVAGYLANNPRDLRYPEIEQFGARPFVSQPPLALYLFAFLGNFLGNMETGAVMTSVLLGTATVGVVYALGYLTHGRTAGAFAGLFLAVLPFHVNLSRKAYLDATMTFFMALAVLCFVLWARKPTQGRAWATGFAVAAAVFSKLPGVLILAPLLLALAWGSTWKAFRRKETALQPATPIEAPQKAPGRFRLGWHMLAAAAPTLVAGLLYLFLILYLDSLRDLALKMGFQYSRVTDSAPLSVQTPRPWSYYFSDPNFGVIAQLGIVMFFLVVVGLVFTFMRWPRGQNDRMGQIALLLWPVAILAFFTYSQRKEWFYLLPAMPPLAVYAGVGGAAALGWLVERFSQSKPLARRVPTFAVVGVLVLAIVPTASPAYQAVNEVVLEDRQYGYGVKEAALLIHDLDPEAAQLGTILGRFTLHFYNGQPAYHWYVDHTFVEEEIQAGRLRFIVLDTHLRIPWEEQWMRSLAEKYGAEVIQTYGPTPEKVKVTVYDFGPSSPAP